MDAVRSLLLRHSAHAANLAQVFVNGGHKAFPFPQRSCAPSVARAAQKCKQQDVAPSKLGHFKAC